MEQLSFKIENFEGPLDLLLHLIARHKMTLLDVRINLLIDQYLEFIGDSDPELESASEFIEMAARLVQMKSAALLPRPEEAEEMQRELVGQLVEYHLCKMAAEKLRCMEEGLFFAVRLPLRAELPAVYRFPHHRNELQAAFMGLSERSGIHREESMGAFADAVSVPVVSVTARVMHILRLLRRDGTASLLHLFSSAKSRSEAVATFLGLLELIRAGRLEVSDDGYIRPPARRQTQPAAK